MNIKALPNIGAMVAVRNGAYAGRVGTVSEVVYGAVHVKFHLGGACILHADDVEEIEAI